jgi:osmoprotectant transport system permease protein
MLIIAISTRAQPIDVGAKHFNEGYILSEIIAQLLEQEGFEVNRRFNLGGTLVCFEALRNGDIDVYPEYSGTLSAEILKIAGSAPYKIIREKLNTQFDLEISEPYGFSNSYALIVKRSMADRKHIKTISDLQFHPLLRIGLSYEFLKRQDGWDNLAKAYNLSHQPVGLEHGLAYQALARNEIELTDAYSTDGEILKYDLVVLEDDRDFFPEYKATSFYRRDLDPRAIEILSQLSGRFSETEMQAMNADVLYDGKAFEKVAAEFLKRNNLSDETPDKTTSILKDILLKTFTHLQLTFTALLFAVFVGLPTGIFIYWKPFVSRPVLYLTGLLQTIPSIALLAIMIPLFGIGPAPAIVALFLYALLPILRNTVIGLQSVDPLLKKVAMGIGMNKRQILSIVEFPLALPAILAGIRTAAVINVGTATLAAFIGAGGLGEYIVTGLALNNTPLILRGAIPAAMLALLIELIFEITERLIVPKHLRAGLS